MSYKIVINVGNEEDLAFACEEVAKLINNGYNRGLIGYSSDSWSVEEE